MRGSLEEVLGTPNEGPGARTEGRGLYLDPNPAPEGTQKRRPRSLFPPALTRMVADVGHVPRRAQCPVPGPEGIRTLLAH